MKIIPVVGLIFGICVIAAFVAVVGAAPISQALLTIGWLGFSVICLIHLAVIAGMGFAWRAVVPATPAWILLWGRLVRDAGSEILPFSQIGGVALGARAVALLGVPPSTAVASTIVDISLEFIAKLAYLVLGLLWLLHLRPASPVALPLIISLIVTGIASLAFLAVQRSGFGIFDRLLRLLARGWADQLAAGAAVLHTSLAEIYRRRSGLWVGFLLHLACWIASALEVWVALRCAGMPLEFGTVLVIESLLYGIRTFAFAIPGAIGVQEATYVFIGASFGLTPGIALALSLLKRARDLAIGLPTLGLLQAVEGERLWRRGGHIKSANHQTRRAVTSLRD
jgi:glycosyltransferase 2 family protein